ncbi:hypothetical protein SHJG_p1023 (plasmid) [Streptomyces hygroscopicus subsp. jinggangensis 5008]|nr:hypothetical protein SHJG_p1023 [Streptomyces hygroscopicus subsp. jinggangensis 5008]AGF68308.1 hypothetical protein SHJGH_p1023 [Streptomyces hygroscopicus subsp. jinggangensis TL01]
MGHQAARAIRAAPPLQSPRDPPADPSLAAARRLVDDLAANTHAIGELLLEVAPVYLSDADAIFGARRALHGAVP